MFKYRCERQSYHTRLLSGYLGGIRIKGYTEAGQGISYALVCMYMYMRLRSQGTENLGKFDSQDRFSHCLDLLSEMFVAKGAQ